MARSGSIRWGVIGALAAFLSGCGDPHGSVAIPQTPESQAREHPAKNSGALIYATGSCGGVCVIAYPGGQLVASIALSGLVQGECSDTNGNVFVTDGTQVVEYAHGGTTPIKTLPIPGNYAMGCAIDPTTGNLAVTYTGSGSANVAVFSSASGQPTTYPAATFTDYCGYDNAGDLFVSGYPGSGSNMAELPAGQSSFHRLTIIGKVGNPGQVQWDGREMTFESRSPGKIRILRLSISASSATVVGKAFLRNIRDQALQSWIDGTTVIVPYGQRTQYANTIGVWKYPKGGVVQVRYRNIGRSFYGVTLSVAPGK
jgi:hypothetical protein